MVLDLALVRVEGLQQYVGVRLGLLGEQSVPALRNPVTEALASKPDDNEAMGRLKNAVEGTVLAPVAARASSA